MFAFVLIFCQCTCTLHYLVHFHICAHCSFIRNFLYSRSEGVTLFVSLFLMDKCVMVLSVLRGCLMFILGLLSGKLLTITVITQATGLGNAFQMFIGCDTLWKAFI